MTTWIFGYGSLLFRPGFPFERSERARARGFSRRFYQGSPDHRGTPQLPGRVVTLVVDAAAACDGLAFVVRDAHVEPVLRDLDVREQGGYTRAAVDLELASGESARATTWIALPDNPHFLGEAPLDAIATHARSSRGPSGENADYVLRLDETLRALGVDDPHVRGVAALLRRA